MALFMLFAMAGVQSYAENEQSKNGHVGIFSTLTDERIDINEKYRILDEFMAAKHGEKAKKPSAKILSDLLKYFSSFDGDSSLLFTIRNILLANGQRGNIEQVCVSFLKTEIAKARERDVSGIEKVAMIIWLVSDSRIRGVSSPDSAYNLPKEVTKACYDIKDEDISNAPDTPDDEKIPRGLLKKNLFSEYISYLFLDYCKEIQSPSRLVYLFGGDYTSGFIDISYDFIFSNKRKNFLLSKLPLLPESDLFVLYALCGYIPYLTETDIGKIIDYLKVNRHLPMIYRPYAYHAILILRCATHKELNNYKDFVQWWEADSKTFKILDSALDAVSNSNDPNGWEILGTQLEICWKDIDIEKVQSIIEKRYNDAMQRGDEELASAIGRSFINRQSCEQESKYKEAVLQFLSSVTGDKIVDE
jgi:hypothetical protein